jgi:ribonuclease Z
VQLGVPKGPFWGRLQSGQRIVLADGREIKPDEVLGPARIGRHLAYVVDTRPTKTVYTLCRNVDIAFVEGMFLQEDQEHADAKGHLTVVEAARMAGRAGVRKAVLVHLSPRYGDDHLTLLEEQARGAFEKAMIGRDLDIYSVPYSEDS